jgi:two-component sensor histidine kinase
MMLAVSGFSSAGSGTPSGELMKRRLLAVAAAAMLPALAMLGYNEFSVRHQRSIETDAQVSMAARQVSSELDRIIEGARAVLITAPSVSSIADLEPAACRQALKEVVSQLEAYRTILVLSPKGDVVCDSRPAPLVVNLGDRPYFKEASKTRDVVIGEYTIGRLSKDRVLPIARSVWQGDQLKAVLVAGLRLDWLQKRIEERGTLPGGSVSIIDKNGIILARTPSPEKYVGTRISDKYLYLLHQSHPGTATIDAVDGVRRILGYEPLQLPSKPLYVGASIAEAEALSSTNRATIVSVIAISAGVVIAFLAANFVGNRFILRPIDDVVDVLERWSAGDTSVRTHMVATHGEIGQVGSSVDRLLDELDRRQAIAEEAEAARALLTRELSHRVKNTLSIIQVMLRQSFRKLVPGEIFDASIRRIQALSGAYDVLLSESWERSDMHDVVDTALKPHHTEGDGRIRASGPQVQMPAQAVIGLSLVLHELATNAAKYGALRDADGRVDVAWRLEEGELVLDWTETGGPPVSAPQSQGFGTSLIQGAFPAGFNPRAIFDFALQGLRFTLRVEWNRTAAAS